MLLDATCGEAETMRRSKMSTTTSSGTVTTTPAAMMVPYGVSKRRTGELADRHSSGLHVLILQEGQG